MRATDIPARWGQPWTNHEIRYLREANARGESRSASALTLNRPLGGVRQKVQTLGLQYGVGRPPRRLPSRTQIAKLKAEGMSLRAIAQLYKCDRKTISYRLGTWRPQRFPSYKSVPREQIDAR